MTGLDPRKLAGVSRIKPLSGRRPIIISVLDIGSTKISCLIARSRPREGEALRLVQS